MAKFAAHDGRHNEATTHGDAADDRNLAVMCLAAPWVIDEANRTSQRTQHEQQRNGN